MKKISLKIKVPIIFTSTIVITALVSLFIIGFFSQKKIEILHSSLLSKFAQEHSHDLLTKNKKSLDYKMQVWLKNEKYFFALLYLDNEGLIISSYGTKNQNYQKIILKTIKKTHNKSNSITIIRAQDKDLLIMPIRSNNFNLGYLVALAPPNNIFSFITNTSNEVKNTAFYIFIAGIFIIAITSYFLIRFLLKPILEMSDFATQNTHLNPSSLRPFPIKNQQYCWIIKNCKKTNCKYYKQKNKTCWNKLLEYPSGNPIPMPCMDCEVFLNKTGDEIENLKLFLNQLITSMKHHYDKNKSYSLSLEEMINARTKELKIKTKKLELETQKSNLLLENVSEAIIVTDMKGKIVQFNGLALELFNIIIPEKLSFPYLIHQIIQDQKIAKEINKIISTTIDLEQGQTSEFSYSQTGNERYLSVKTTILQEPQHNSNMIICLARNITNNKLLENFKEEFFHMISHDLKNPLTSIIGFLDLLRNGSERKGLNNNQIKYLNYAYNSSHEMQFMLKDLSNIVKLQTQRVTLNKISFSIHELLEDISTVFLPEVTKNQLKIDFSIQPSQAKLTADYQKIKQILTNLIANAIKANSTLIKITAIQKNKNTVFSIKDNGQGIPPNKLPYIFEKFTQLYTYQDKEEGLGLGLAIVKSLINLHNGNINVSSKENKGTEFIITLPNND